MLTQQRWLLKHQVILAELILNYAFLQALFQLQTINQLVSNIYCNTLIVN